MDHRHERRAEGRIDRGVRFFEGKWVTKVKVEELTPDAVRWRVVSGPEDWIGTEIAYELTKSADNDSATVLRFRHHGWKEGVDFMGHCSAKWAYFLFSLKSYLEVGTGTPHPHDLSI